MRWVRSYGYCSYGNQRQTFQREEHPRCTGKGRGGNPTKEKLVVVGNHEAVRDPQTQWTNRAGHRCKDPIAIGQGPRKENQNVTGHNLNSAPELDQPVLCPGVPEVVEGETDQEMDWTVGTVWSAEEMNSGGMVGEGWGQPVMESW
jgi:hypothetical protein